MDRRFIVLLALFFSFLVANTSATCNGNTPISVQAPQQAYNGKVVLTVSPGNAKVSTVEGGAFAVNVKGQTQAIVDAAEVSADSSISRDQGKLNIRQAGATSSGEEPQCEQTLATCSASTQMTVGYDDSLVSTWTLDDLSFDDVELANTESFFSGASSIKWSLGEGGNDFIIHTDEFTQSDRQQNALTLWVNIGSGDQDFNIKFYSQGSELPCQQPFSAYYGGAFAQGWKKVFIPISSFGVSDSDTIDGFAFSVNAGSSSNPIWFDMIGFECIPTTTPSTAPIAVAINFGPSAYSIPGYISDYGKAYSDAQGYGWSSDQTTSSRKTNSAAAPDAIFDSFVRIRSGQKWEFAVEPADYIVSMALGRADRFGALTVKIEDDSIVGNTTSCYPWYGYSNTLTVSDGRLTVAAVGNNYPNSINAIKFETATGTVVRFVLPSVKRQFMGTRATNPTSFIATLAQVLGQPEERFHLRPAGTSARAGETMDILILGDSSSASYAVPSETIAASAAANTKALAASGFPVSSAAVVSSSVVAAPAAAASTSLIVIIAASVGGAVALAAVTGGVVAGGIYLAKKKRKEEVGTELKEVLMEDPNIDMMAALHSNVNVPTELSQPPPKRNGIRKTFFRWGGNRDTGFELI